jgi:hypothetical protein
MTTSILKIPHPRHVEEYQDAAERIFEVLQKHFPQYDRIKLIETVDHFMAAQKTFEDDFWSKANVVIDLEDLPRLLTAVRTLYDKIPEIVKSELTIEADCHHRRAVEKYKNTTTKDILFQSDLPRPNATNGLRALQSVAEHHKEISEVFAKVKRELPDGMPTKSRPGPAYSVIYAALEICKGQDVLNVPGAVRGSGDFFRLLDDLFKLLGIKTSPEGAYDGWIENIGINYENFDLIPI